MEFPSESAAIQTWIDSGAIPCKHCGAGIGRFSGAWGHLGPEDHDPEPNIVPEED